MESTSCDIQCCHAACLLCFDAHPCIAPRMCNYCWHTLLCNLGLIFLFRDQISWDKFKPSPLSNWFNDELVAVIKLLDMMICYNQSRRSVLQLPLARLGMDCTIIMADTSYLELHIISIYRHIHMVVYNIYFLHFKIVSYFKLKLWHLFWNGGSICDAIYLLRS